MQESAQPLLVNRPLETGENLDLAFSLLRRTWRPLAVLSLFVILPNLAMSLLTPAAFDPTSEFSNAFFVGAVGGIPRTGALLEWIGGWILVTLFVTPLLYGSAIILCSQAFLGQTPHLGAALKQTIRRYPALLGTGWLYFLLLLLAFPVLVIGGLLVLSPLTLIGGYTWGIVHAAFTLQTLLIEGLPGGFIPMRRSYQLAKGRFWPLLLLGICYMLFGTLCNIWGTSLMALAGGLVGLLASEGSTWVLWLMSVLAALIQWGGLVVLLAGLTLTYYDLRIRKEGFDLAYMLEAQSAQVKEA